MTSLSIGYTHRTNEYTVLKRILKELNEVVARENKRPFEYADLTPSLLALLEEEIIPSLENELDGDPTPQYLYDNTGGEPPVTANEMYEIARAHSKLLHS
jgi:hypothetical protein